MTAANLPRVTYSNIGVDFAPLHDDRKVEYLYRRFFARAPAATETNLARMFITRQADAVAPPPTSSATDAMSTTKAMSPTTPWERYIQVLMLTNEFAYVD